MANSWNTFVLLLFRSSAINNSVPSRTIPELTYFFRDLFWEKSRTTSLKVSFVLRHCFFTDSDLRILLPNDASKSQSTDLNAFTNHLLTHLSPKPRILASWKKLEVSAKSCGSTTVRSHADRNDPGIYYEQKPADNINIYDALQCWESAKTRFGTSVMGPSNAESIDHQHKDELLVPEIGTIFT